MSWVEAKAALAMTISLLGCGVESRAAAADTRQAGAARELRGIFDRYWEENLGLHPQIATSTGDMRFPCEPGSGPRASAAPAALPATMYR
jgi:hypothetical protein